MNEFNSTISSLGYLGIGFIIFIETGLPIGIFFPGNSLLFASGILASQGIFELPLLLLVVFTSSVVGDSVSFFIGKQLNSALEKGTHSLIFSQAHITKTKNFYLKHGAMAIIIAKFMPITRTLSPIIAGASKVAYIPKFLPFSILGSLSWAVSLVVLGFALGRILPEADSLIVPIILLVILLSALPNIIHFLKDPIFRKNLKNKLSKLV